MYQAEHDALFRGDSQGQGHQRWGAHGDQHHVGDDGPDGSYTGQQITWDEAMNSQEKIFPDNLEWGGSMPPQIVPLPGSEEACLRSYY
jgi:hypothetical protein